MLEKDLALIEVNPGDYRRRQLPVLMPRLWSTLMPYPRKDLQAMRDPSQEDGREAAAAAWGLNYVAARVILVAW